MGTAAVLDRPNEELFLQMGLRPTAKALAPEDHELVVDNFAGAGGASLGIEAALGRAVDVAINHNPKAIRIHQVNHPATRHFIEDIFQVKPRVATRGRPVGLAWFSPDCRHYSRAKGGKPVNKKIRGLAWVVIRWAKEVRPRVIILENVPEFAQWGPLDSENKSIKSRMGETYCKWEKALRDLGYQVEKRELVAADYGVPTIRKRLFLIARCDGQPIVWPERTHWPRAEASEGSLTWRPAADCIDWSLPCPSIFNRKRALAAATMRRIFLGMKKFVLENQEPFLVTCNHQGEGFRGQGLGEPFKTITGARDAHGLVVPYLNEVGVDHGGAEEPLLFEGWILKNNKKSHSSGLNEPLHTIPGNDKYSLMAAYLTKLYGSCRHGADVREPMPTVTGGGHHIAEVRAFLIKYFGTAKGQDLRDPAHTITSKDRFGLVTVQGTLYQIRDIGLRMLTTRELLRAQFGRFANEFVLVGTHKDQVSGIGNSVCPEVAEALVKANVRIQLVKAA